MRTLAAGLLALLSLIPATGWTAVECVAPGDIYLVNTYTEAGKVFRLEPSATRPTPLPDQGTRHRTLDVAWHPDGFLLVATGPLGQILRVEPLTGDRSVFWEKPGSSLAPLEIAVGLDGSVYARVYELPAPGERTLFAEDGPFSTLQRYSDFTSLVSIDSSSSSSLVLPDVVYTPPLAPDG